MRTVWTGSDPKSLQPLLTELCLASIGVPIDAAPNLTEVRHLNFAFVYCGTSSANIFRITNLLRNTHYLLFLGNLNFGFSRCGCNRQDVFHTAKEVESVEFLIPTSTSRDTTPSSFCYGC